MELAKKPFTFSDGRSITVMESTWEASSLRTKIEEKARADKSRLNGSGSKVLFYFLETFYSYLASCSSGDVPNENEAFSLSDVDLDEWNQAVIDVNPEMFLTADRRARGEVTFRDGSKFEIVSSYLPSVTMKRYRLEMEGLKKETDPEHPKDVLAVFLYPVLASCSLGSLPTVEELRRWPEAEIYKWRDAVEMINPHLFGNTPAQTIAEAKQEEKKSKRPQEELPHGSVDSSRTPETTSPRV